MKTWDGLDDEHDRFLWLPATDAAAKCLPPLVGRTLLVVDEWLEQTARPRERPR